MLGAGQEAVVVERGVGMVREAGQVMLALSASQSQGRGNETNSNTKRPIY